jgi:hypothetical protein
MSNTPRADEHEGLLTDPELKKQADKVAKRTAAILRNDVAELTESGAFLRFFGRYATPALFEDYPVNNGSTLAHFMGGRGLVLRMIKELENEHPGFIDRMLAARLDYQRELEKAAVTP